jgi:sugar phosphate isomerase/epimerase
MHSPVRLHPNFRLSTFFAVAAGWLLLGYGAWAAPEFFVFDNGLGRGSWTPEQQARTAKSLGYDGISYNYTNPGDLAVWLKTLKAHGLKLYGLYVHTFVDKAEHYDPTLKEAIQMLNGTDAIVWITLRETKVKGDFDTDALKVVQDIADQAQASGVRVALYPHAGFYVATTADALRLVRSAQRANVGASLNLCHEFMTGHGNRLDETIRLSAPHLMLVSVNGVEVAGKQYILRLDQGDFDVAGFLKKLPAAGYKGPIGLQCYNVKGDVEENLRADIAAWRKITSQLHAP